AMGSALTTRHFRGKRSGLAICLKNKVRQKRTKKKEMLFLQNEAGILLKTKGWHLVKSENEPENDVSAMLIGLVNY
ncbi:MAG: hypothetical protein ACRD3T_15720, partial [Terriglobia bacterium]